MLLDDFFTEEGMSSPAEIRPTRPTRAKTVGRLETVAAAGLSNKSDTSDTKSEGAKPQGESKHSVPLPMDWTPDTIEGRPCCYLPYVPERVHGLLLPDLKGFGVPAAALPFSLRGFSIAGWRLELGDEEVRMVKVNPHARMEHGCKGYLRVNSRRVREELRQWNVDMIP